MKRRREQIHVAPSDASFAMLAASIEANRPEADVFGDVVDHQVARATGWDKPRVEQGEAAWRALVKVEEELENYGYSVAQVISSAEWLWYLRRARWLFEGHGRLATTAPYMAAIAESIGALSAAPPRPSVSPSPRLTYAIDDESARAVLRLYAVAERLHLIHGALRWAGKGSAIKAQPDGLPVSDPTPELEVMVELWDDRIAVHGSGLLAPAGLYSHSLGQLPDSAQFLGTVPIVGRDRTGGYGLAPFQVGELPTLRDAELPVSVRWPTAALDLIALLWTTVVHLGDMERSDLWHEVFRRTGYRVVTRVHLLNELRVAVDLLGEHRLGGAIPRDAVFGSPERVFGRLATAEVAIWPPTQGPPLRQAANDLVFVDLFSAAARLADAFARPGDLVGEDANRWARHYETTIQGAINASAWRPSSAVADLRGRHLTIDGRAVTDIDAIGERDGRLLLVSCKCQPFSINWDRGEYAAVRNVATAVDRAVEEWATRIERLRSRPLGDNYNFTGYETLIGVVVTPSVPWSPNPASVNELAPGLRAAASATEFGDWLETRERPLRLE